MEKKYSLLLAALVLISFSPCLGAQFLSWDDGTHFWTNPFVYDFSWKNLIDIFKQTINSTYIPLNTLSYNIEYHLFDLPPWRVHLENIVLHLAIVLIIFRLSQQFGLTLWQGLIASSIFAVHPIHVESVAWATERKDVLSGLFYLLSLEQYWKYLQNHSAKIAFRDNLFDFPPQPSFKIIWERLGRSLFPLKNLLGKQWPSFRKLYNFLKGKKNYLLSLALGFLSVLAKPMAVSLPWILFLLDWWTKRRLDRNLLLDKIPFAITIFSIAAVTFLKLAPRPDIHFPDSILIILWSAAFYLEKFFWPQGLLPLYIPPQPVTLANPIYLKALVILLLFITSIFIGRKNRLWIFSCLFWIGSIFFLGRLDFADINVVADRFMYLPSIVFCLFLGVCLARFRMATSILIITLGFLTFHQCHIWKNDVTLWRWTLQNAPNNLLARKKLNIALYDPKQNKVDYKNFDHILKQYPDRSKGYAQRGKILLEDGKPELAFNDFNHAILLNPLNLEAYNSRGLLYRLKGNHTKALVDFNKAISLNPDDPIGYVHKAISLKETRNITEAFQSFDQALRLDPHLGWAYYERGNVYRQLGRCDQAIEDFTKAINYSQQPKDSYYQRGLCYETLQHWTNSEEDFKKVLKEDKYDTKSMIALGGIYFKTNQYDKALEIYNQAIAIDPYFDKPYNNRGIIHLKKRQYQLALADYTKAIDRSNQPYHALITRGDIYAMMGKTKKALADYNAAILVSEGDPIASVKRNQILDLGH